MSELIHIAAPKTTRVRSFLMAGLLCQSVLLSSCGGGGAFGGLFKPSDNSVSGMNPEPTPDQGAPQPTEPAWKYPWERPGLDGFVGGPDTLAIMFEAKGDVFGMDIGITQALMENINPDAIGSMMYLGSSSGSLGAAYFACNGLSPESIARMVTFLGTIREKIIPDPTFGNAIDIVGGINLERPLTSTDPIVNFITGGQTCVPRYPLLVVAGNKEIVDDRDGILGNTLGKRLTQATFDVWNNRDVFLGKACTYFVNEPAAKLVERIPAQERLCDIRRIQSPADLTLAVRSSIAEPTFFQPVPEPSPQAIQYALPGAGHNLQRLYYGGFINTAPAQDIKRAAPAMRIFGTGRNPFGVPEQTYARVSFNVNLNDTLAAGHWWTDSSIDLPESDWTWARGEKITLADQVGRGYQIASSCLKKDSCRASNRTRPASHHRIDDWLLPATQRQTLAPWTNRGLGPMLKTQQSIR